MAKRAAGFCLVALPMLLLAPPVAAQVFTSNEFWGVYMYYMPANLPSPVLQVAATNDNVSLSWPISGSNFVVQTTGDLTQSGAWTNASAAPDLAGDAATVTMPVTNAQQFFRLKGPYNGIIPIFEFAVFYNGLLEFSTCPTWTVGGRVHANSDIYTGSSAPLTFNSTVTTTGTISSPGQNGQGPGYTGSWANTGTYNGSPASTTNVPYILLPLGTNNVHAIIDIPPAGEDPTSALGQQRLYNEAPVVILVSNTTLTVKIRTSINGQVPGADPSPTTLLFTNTSNTYLATNGLPFLSTNSFTDKRENDLVKCTQIDVGKYASWIATNSFVTDKFPAGSGTYPTILYVGDQRTYALGSQLTAVRLTNGVVPPANGGLGFSVATFNPMYVLGHYNQTNSAYLGTTNTSSGTVPCALMSDALTILSPNWQDSQSASTYTTRIAANDTVNAAILTGIVPSTGSSSTTFSGGVHNLPRLLEDWNSPSTHTLTLNTSIVNLFNSQMATSQFQNPGVYYDPPTRQFSFDVNFANPAKQPPPGTPNLAVMLRSSWAIPPANTVNYYVTP
jgi:hypothetical protein